jgi:signal transduction histidine kinase
MELASLNNMSSQLQSSLKLSDILNILTSHTLTILDARKTRCIMRLSNLRIMITESFMLGEVTQTRSGMATATKELLDRSNGVYPIGVSFIYAPLKVDGKIIGVLEAVPQDNAGQEEMNQKILLLRTIAETGAQAIQRAMLITKNIKAQKLAAVSRTAIAANHEINSPLTTILLKLDMLAKDTGANRGAATNINEIKTEALKIKNIVKKMLEISDVVETSYIKNEKMLDLHHTPDAQKAPQQEEPSREEAVGFEDYLEDKAQGSPREPARRNEPAAGAIKPGFEDFVDQQVKELKKGAAEDSGKAPAQSTPGFEDYIDQQTRELDKQVGQVSGKATSTDTPGFEDYLD